MQTTPLRSSYTKRLMLSGLMLCLFAGCKPEADVQRDIAAQEAAQKAAAAAAAEESLVAQKAGVGVGVKGRSLEGSSESNPATLISAPAAAYFRTKEKIAFEIQIPQALNLYMAEKGRNPRNHDEFMRDIIDANRIVLPKLPTGMVYRYDSEKGELWVIPEKDLQSPSGQQPSP
ncbi:MAG: hypothetical protein LW850_25690 [Planctomycetaceae bacterium]|jgi:hypothetical protein|nr:hypothetical protein [Planctomycetaceae bacterium]MCE2813789.1 hypothetical protein [Planctomycetaceae bacterium]